MTAPKGRQAPPWLDTSQPMSDRPRLVRCGWCHGLILTALVGNPCGLTVRVDPVPLDLEEELAAHTQGRSTYCLRLHRYLESRLLTRGPEHIVGGGCAHAVVADHHCTGPAAPPADPTPEPQDDNRLF